MAVDWIAGINQSSNEVSTERRALTTSTSSAGFHTRRCRPFLPLSFCSSLHVAADQPSGSRATAATAGSPAMLVLLRVTSDESPMRPERLAQPLTKSSPLPLVTTRGRRRRTPLQPLCSCLLVRWLTTRRSYLAS